MFLIENTMIKNTLNIAKKKLEMHKDLGAQSSLSIFDVANLLDIIKRNEAAGKQKDESLFFSYSAN